MSDSSFAPTKIMMQPGYKRDGTSFNTQFSTGGLWTRFFSKLPRKMGGFSRFNFDILGTPREIWTDDKDRYTYIHIMSDSGIVQVKIDQISGAMYAPTDRTPVGFVNSIDNSWQTEEIYDQAGAASILLACLGGNIGSIDSSTNGIVYSGDPYDIVPFTAASFTPGNPDSTSGGLCVIPPYAFYYGDDGYLTWSAPNDPFNLATADGGGGVAGVRIADSKIIKGAAFRGGSAGPTGLFWSLNSVTRANFVGGAPVFSFSTLADYISPINSRSIVQYDSNFYWPDKGRFLTFNGSVQEVKNDYNLRWFYENLNWQYRSKCFGISMADWGEIWWCFPYGSNTEPSHAIILNLRDQCFYDTALPDFNRTAGIESYGYRYPLMASNYERDSDSIVGALWDHEKGQDKVIGTTYNAIQSYFLTPFISLPHNAAGNFGVTVTDYEPDILFNNEMSITLIGRLTPTSADVTLDTKFFTPIDPVIHLNNEYRMIQLKIESNAAGNSFVFGENNLLYIQPGGQRNTL